MSISKNKRFNTVFKLSAISYFKEEDGYCYFSKKNFMDTFFEGKKDCISNDLKDFEREGLIENLTTNGYYSKIKILDDDMKCYDFMLNKNLTARQRGFLYEIKDLLVPDGKTKYPIKYISRIKLIEEGCVESNLYNIRRIINIEDTILNKQEVHGLISPTSGELIKDENGYKLSIKEKKVCKYCGENDQNKFFYLNKNICLECSKQHTIDQGLSTAVTLYNRSKSSARNRKLNHSLTIDYIKDIFKLQNYKCAYSGLEFDYSNKNGIPTIDRIDSSKGYEIDNISIVRCDVNLMKNNMSLEQFNYLIDKICEHRKCGCNK